MELPPEELSILRIFSRRAKDISNSVIFRENRITVGLNIKWEKGGPTLTSRKGPNNQELLPIVTIVRQLYMENENISFRRVYNIVYKQLENNKDIDPRILSCAKSAMSAYKKILKKERLSFSISMGGKTLGPQEIIDIWFNGNIFHADIDKAEKYDRLWTAPTGPLADFIFRSTIVELANLMIYFGGIIDSHLLNKVE